MKGSNFMCKGNQILSEQLHCAEEKWHLSDISCVYETENKAVYTARAAEWGSVVVKTGVDKNALAGEFYTLTALRGAGCCKAFAFDKIHGIIIEERILPGNTLREEQDPQKRVKCFCAVFQQIHTGIGGAGGYDTYIDWLQRADIFLKKSGSNEEIKKGMHTALRIGEEMFEKYPERMLLHGDLHHDNILLSSEKGYCMIDPKGVIGPPIFDTPRFLLNEFDYVSYGEAAEHLEMISRMMAEGTGYCEEDIKKLLFMETMLANVWCMEDGEDMDEGRMKAAAALLWNL